MSCPEEAELLAFVFGDGAGGVVDLHLADCQDCRRLALALAGDEDPPRAGEAPAAARLGRFEVEAEIGRGAMGRVVRARDPELGRPVAIKLRIGGGPLDPAGDERLQREAHALARLSHPNVVAVYEVGREAASEGERPYVVMEYVAGSTLDQWWKGRTAKEVLKVLVEVTRGLGAAHRVGVVHRDVKPSNVLVTADGVGKIGDFGLARLEHGDGGGAAAPGTPDEREGELWGRLSGTRSLIGTPAYMAPEQLRGERGDERSDQFQFCVMAVEALAGRRPFEGNTAVALHAAIERGKRPERPDGVPPRAWRALLRGLSPSAAARHGSMEELGRELEDRSRGKGRALAVGGALAIGALAIGAFAMKAMEDPASRCAQAPEAAERVFGAQARGELERWLAGQGQAVQAASLGRAMEAYGRRWGGVSQASCVATVNGRQSAASQDVQRRCLTRLLRRADDLRGVLLGSGQERAYLRAFEAFEALPRPEACLTVEPGQGRRDPPPVGAVDAISKVEARLDHVLNMEVSGQPAAVLEETAELVGRARTIGYAPLVAQALVTRAQVVESLERYQELEELLDEAGRQAAIGGDDLQVAEAWTRRVYAGHLLGRPDDALRWLPAAETAVLRAGDPPALRLSLLEHTAILAVGRGEYTRAQQVLEQVLALRQREAPVQVLALASAHKSLAVVLFRADKPAQARHHYEEAMRLVSAAYGERHPDVIGVLINLGALLCVSDPEQAIRYLERSQTLGEEVLGKDSSSVARSLENLGIARYELGDFADAVASHRRAHAIKQRTLPPGHPRLAASLANLGTALLAMGQLDEAVAAYREAVLLLSQGSAAGTVDLWNVRAGLGDALAAAGAHDAAIAEYRQALAGYDASDAGEGQEAATARVALARLLLHQPRPEVAAARAQLEMAARALEAGADRDHAVQALANLLMCDLLEAHAVGAKLQALEEASARAGRLEDSTAVYVSYVRARALAQLGRRDEARRVAATTRTAAAGLAIPLHPRGLRWLRGLR